MKVKDVGPLAAARKGKGWSQSELADRSGVQQGNISGYEAGTKTLGTAAAKKLGKALGANPVLLVIHSQKARLDKAKKRGDAAEAILAVKSIVEASEELPLQEDDERALDHLVDSVVAFANGVGGYHDPSEYGQDEAEKEGC